MKRFTRSLAGAIVAIIVASGVAAAFGAGSSNDDANKDIVVNVAQHHQRKAHPVTLVKFGGRQYNCTSSGEADAMAVKAKLAVRVKRTYGLRSSLREMVHKYPHGAPTDEVYARYRALLHRFNVARHASSGAMHKYNRVLREECEAS